MKKIIFSLVVTAFMFGMTACTDDRDLTGTTWNGMLPIVGFDAEFESNIFFNSDSTGVMVVYGFGDSVMYDVKYSCDSKGNGIMTTLADDGTYVRDEFAVIGDELTLFDNENKVKFKKQ